MSVSNLLQPNPMATAMHWLPLERGWIKLNTDGAMSSNSSNNSIGGVFRDSDAKLVVWLLNDDRQLDIECDNALLVESLLDGGAANSKMVELRLIHQLLCRSWK
ncbi:hypothetical protein Goshw_024425, partial [Gossypium schwendimanii]|nr:hypothetical protein [Gossypium schwendimanii]